MKKNTTPQAKPTPLYLNTTIKLVSSDSEATEEEDNRSREKSLSPQRSHSEDYDEEIEDIYNEAR